MEKSQNNAVVPLSQMGYSVDQVKLIEKIMNQPLGVRVIAGMTVSKKMPPLENLARTSEV